MRECHIILERRFRDNPTTLDDLSQHHEGTRERIRQTEARAISKRRRSVLSASHRRRSESPVCGTARRTPVEQQ